VLLALFNHDNNQEFLSAAATTFTSGIFHRSSICTLDYWEIPRGVLMLFNPPTADLKVMTRVQKRNIIRRSCVKPTADSGGGSDDSDSDEHAAAEPMLVDASGVYTIPVDIDMQGVAKDGFARRSNRAQTRPVLLTPSHAPSLQPRPAPTPLQDGDATFHNEAEVDREPGEIEGGEGEISEGDAEFEREQAAVALPGGKRAKGVAAGVKVRGKVPTRKAAPANVYQKTYSAKPARRGAKLNAE